MSLPDKEIVRRDWTARGEAWDRWADVVAASAQRMNEPLLAAADIQPGLKALDLASGAGQPAFAIAERLGPSGELIATDLVPEMLAGARKRAAALKLDNIRFEIADMEALPFSDRSFDRVTCRFGIMFVPKVEQALGEVRRVLRPGGRAAFMVWGPWRDTTMFRVFVGVTDRILGPDPEHNLLTAFRFGAPGSLANLFARVGFQHIEEKEIRLSGRMSRDKPFWRPQLEMSLGARLGKTSAEQRRALEAEVEKAFADEISGDQYVLDAHVRIVSANTP